MKIGIDPGHGGGDAGAVGANGNLEKDINLAIAQRVQYLLLRQGMEVVMTRCDDSSKSLAARTNLLNSTKVDYVVSIHCNSSADPAPNYISTYIQGIGGEAERLAEKVQARLVQTTGWPNGGVRVQNLHMTRETLMPAILCECGFISNPLQEIVLAGSESQSRIARAIADGINDFLNQGGGSSVAEQWQFDIIDNAMQEGLITSDHNPYDYAPKWFVLQVALNLLNLIKKD